ncbi:OsmC family protein [Acidithiobacillus thiooxidans]|uniref:OsmC family protein n=1 Tax=Acidithiobacillus thiooxidans TaxID=930 RepID=UPI001D02B4C0|nr:OsmC family protein [Acidithiobacillus thiooxidans]
MDSTPVNGVDVPQLMATIDAVKGDPELAKFVFRAHTEWQTGAHVRTQIQGFSGVKQEDSSRTQPFVIEGDEPPVLLGSNRGPNAVELLLAGLTACLSAGISYNAAARGITIETMTLDVTGDIDLQGFLGISESVRPGCQEIHIACRIKSPASDREIADLLDHVQQTSPVTDMVRYPTPVQVRFIRDS